jgi:hypothetical protein
LYLVIVTLLEKQDVTQTQYQSVDSALSADSAMLSTEISTVSSEYQSRFANLDTFSTTSNNLNLRGRELQSCNPCLGWPSGYYCWWHGVLRPACRRERELTLHKTLDETELSEMSEEDRERHLQAVDMCADATADVVQAIQADITSGKISTPLSSFSHQCLYDVA